MSSMFQMTPSSDVYRVQQPCSSTGDRSMDPTNMSQNESSVVLGRGAVRLPALSVCSDGSYLSTYRTPHPIDELSFSSADPVEDALLRAGRNHHQPVLASSSSSPTPLLQQLRGEDRAAQNGLIQLPYIMSHSRIVSAKIAHLKGELTSVMASLRRFLPAVFASLVDDDLVQQTQQHQGYNETDFRNSHLDAVEATTMLGVLNEIAASIQEAKKCLREMLERPLTDTMTAAGGGGARTPAASGLPSANLSVAVSFGLEQVKLLRHELVTLNDTVLAVEQRIFTALGVENETSAKANTSATPPAAQDLSSSGHAAAAPYVFRRRQDSDMSKVLTEVEAAMRSEPRYAPLRSLRTLAVPTLNSDYAVAGASLQEVTRKYGTEAFPSQRLHRKSEYESELELLEKELQAESMKQSQLREGNTRRSLNTTPNGQGRFEDKNVVTPHPHPHEEEHIEDASAAPSHEPLLPLADEPSGGVVPDTSHGVALAGAPHIIAKETHATADDDIPTPDASMCSNSAACAAHPDDDDVEDLRALLAPAGGNDDDADLAGCHDEDEAEQQQTGGAALPQDPPGPAPTPVHFSERLKQAVRSFLVSGACQWIACEDEQTRKLYFINIETGERLESMEEYLRESIAEVIARELLLQGEDDDEGWILVANGSAEYGDYYCHRRSGVVTWNLVDWVQQN